MADPACNSPAPDDRAPRRPWLGVVGVAAALTALAVAWRVGPLHEWASQSELAARVGAVTASPFGPVAALALFTALTTLMVPLTAMIAATALALPLELAVPVSTTGALLSAWIAFALGRSRYGRRLAERFTAGGRARRAVGALREAGVLAIAGVRLVPVAPFTVVNLAAGSCGVPLRSFLLGTLIGLSPGIAVLSFAASRALGDGHATVAVLAPRSSLDASAPAAPSTPPSDETSP